MLMSCTVEIAVAMAISFGAKVQRVMEREREREAATKPHWFQMQTIIALL